MEADEDRELTPDGLKAFFAANKYWELWELDRETNIRKGEGRKRIFLLELFLKKRQK